MSPEPFLLAAQTPRRPPTSEASRRLAQPPRRPAPAPCQHACPPTRRRPGDHARAGRGSVTLPQHLTALAQTLNQTRPVTHGPSWPAGGMRGLTVGTIASDGQASLLSRSLEKPSVWADASSSEGALKAMIPGPQGTGCLSRDGPERTFSRTFPGATGSFKPPRLGSPVTSCPLGRPSSFHPASA